MKMPRSLARQTLVHNLSKSAWLVTQWVVSAVTDFAGCPPKSVTLSSRHGQSADAHGDRVNANKRVYQCDGKVALLRVLVAVNNADSQVLQGLSLSFVAGSRSRWIV